LSGGGAETARAGDRVGDQSVFTVSGKPSQPCHCEARSAEAISCLTSLGALVRQEIASALRASQ
jgi:hypothetical protein